MKSLLKHLLPSQLFQVSIHNYDMIITICTHVTYTCNHLVLNCLFCSLACLQNYSGGLLWPTSRRNRVVTQSCSTLHLNFRSRVAVSRKCNDDGTWGPVDYSNCTALNDAIPILTISFIVNVSQANARAIADNVS